MYAHTVPLFLSHGPVRGVSSNYCYDHALREGLLTFYFPLLLIVRRFLGNPITVPPRAAGLRRRADRIVRPHRHEAPCAGDVKPQAHEGAVRYRSSENLAVSIGSRYVHMAPLRGLPNVHKLTGVTTKGRQILYSSVKQSCWL
jgi:hypothetical protein